MRQSKQTSSNDAYFKYEFKDECILKKFKISVQLTLTLKTVWVAELSNLPSDEFLGELDGLTAPIETDEVRRRLRDLFAEAVGVRGQALRDHVAPRVPEIGGRLDVHRLVVLLDVFAQDHDLRKTNGRVKISSV